MAASQSFVDLRTSSLNAGSHTDDSVWPSFTDIMTVVVMIFLMSLVVILLRNVELVKSEQESARLAQLKASENVELESAIESLEQRIAQIQLQLQAQILKTEQSDLELEQTQQQATELMADIQALQLLRDKLSGENTELAAAKLALEGRLKIVEGEKTDLGELQQQTELAKLSLEGEKQQLLIQLSALSETKQLLDKTVVEQQSNLATLQQEKDTIILQVQDLEQEKSTLISEAEKNQADFDALKAVYSLLQKDNRSLFDRISDAEQMITELEQNLSSANQTIEEKQQELSVAEAEIESKTQEIEVKTQEIEVKAQEIESKTEELIETREQFTALEEKYLKLVGPARSELDKYVVAIRYRLFGNRAVIDIANPATNTFEQVSEFELHRRLAELKRQKGKDLYTRVVIPSDSGLSYDQAWRFTKDILNRYDYYYQ